MAIFIKKMATGQRLTRWFVLRVHHSRDVIGRTLGQKNALPWRHEGHYCHVVRLRQRWFLSRFSKEVMAAVPLIVDLWGRLRFSGFFFCLSGVAFVIIFYERNGFYSDGCLFLCWVKLMCFILVLAVQWIVLLPLMTLEL